MDDALGVDDDEEPMTPEEVVESIKDGDDTLLDLLDRGMKPGVNVRQNLNKLEPHPDAVGPHSSFKRGQDGKVSGYETYKSSHPRDPVRWRPEKRVDVSGRPHYNKATGKDVPTPHVQGRDVPGGVRPAE